MTRKHDFCREDCLISFKTKNNENTEKVQNVPQGKTKHEKMDQ